MFSSGEKIDQAEEFMSDITKRAISASLKKILCEKNLSKITVQDIADDCGINRQTFYYHFQDIYDLMEWTCIEDAEKVLKENRTYGTWQEGFLVVFVLAKKGKVFITIYTVLFCSKCLNSICTGLFILF